MAKQNSIVTQLILKDTDFVKKLGLSRKEVLTFQRQINNLSGSVTTFARGGLGAIAGRLGPFAALTGGAYGLGVAMKEAGEGSMELEQSLANLSSLTGIAGKDLDSLKASAIALSDGTSMSADDIVNAMTKVGSAMPELLKYKEGLIAVTAAAKTLAAASGMDMESAINSLTGMMNQFGAGAAEASTYVNVLAAASQAGAADVTYLSSVVEKSAGSARSAGVDFTELVAATEAIAPKFSKAEEAGTQMRNVLTRLEVRTTDCKISQLGLNKALENFAKKSDQEKIKLVGEESLRMANALAEARDEVDGYKSAITGTNVAEEQAATRANTLAHACGELSTAWDNFTLSINNSNGVLASFIRGLADGINTLREWIETYDQYVARREGEGAQKAIKDFGAAYNQEVLDSADYSKKGREASMKLFLAGQRSKAKNAIEIYEKELEKELNQPTHGLKGDNPFARVRSMIGVYYEVEKYRQGFSDELASGVKKYTANGADTAALRQQLAYWKSYLDAVENQAAAVQKAKNAMETEPKTGTGKGTKRKPTDPLEASRADLAAMGVDVNAVTAGIAVMERMRKKVGELDTAIAASAGTPELQKKLIAVRDAYKATLDAMREPLTVAGIDLTVADEASKKLQKLESDIKSLESAAAFATGEEREGIISALARLREEKKGLEGTTYIELGGVDVSRYAKAADEAARLARELAQAEGYLSASPQDAGLLALVRRLREESERLNRVFVDGMDVTAYERQSRDAGKLLSDLGRIEQLMRANPGDAGLREKYEELRGKADRLPVTEQINNDQLRRMQRMYELKRLIARLDNQAGEGDEAAQKIAEARRQMYSQELSGLQLSSTLDQVSVVNTAVSSLGDLFSAFGLDELGDEINKVTGVLSTLIGVIVSVNSVLALIETRKALETAKTVASFLPFFSAGGVVGGSSWTGDELLARVNSGELILNKDQQANLIKGLDGMAGGTAAVSIGGKTVVHGESIYISLSNYMRRTGKRL